MSNVRRTKDGNYFDRTEHGTIWYGKEIPKRAILSDEKGVSPVIAVILMVAITVVLAATVFVLVNNITGNQQKPSPSIAWESFNSTKTIRMNAAPPGTLWSDFEVTGCTTVPTGEMKGGQEITGCNGTVTIRHKPSNSLSYQTKF